MVVRRKGLVEVTVLAQNDSFLVMFIESFDWSKGYSKVRFLCNIYSLCLLVSGSLISVRAKGESRKDVIG